MLRYTTAAVALLAVASTASAQNRPAGSPQPDSPQKPAQATEIRGADQNQTQQSQSGARPTTPRNAVPAAAEQSGQSRAENRSSASNIDSHLADCLILSNQEEIALLKFGRERTQNDKIKTLAEKMIADHEKAVEKLKKFASRSQTDLVDSGTAAAGRNLATREARKVGSEDGGSADPKEEKMNRLAHRMAQECLTLTKEELSQHKGHDFDQAFVGQQCGAHIGMLAKLTAIQTEAGEDFGQLVGELRDTTKTHKEHLKKLMDSIKDKESSSK